MSKDKMLEIIQRHNDVVSFMDTLDDSKIPAEAIFRLMPLASKMSKLGLALTHEARKMDIDAKCCMQSGKIKIAGDVI